MFAAVTMTFLAVFWVSMLAWPDSDPVEDLTLGGVGSALIIVACYFAMVA